MKCTHLLGIKDCNNPYQGNGPNTLGSINEAITRAYLLARIKTANLGVKGRTTDNGGG